MKRIGEGKERGKRREERRLGKETEERKGVMLLPRTSSISIPEAGGSAGRGWRLVWEPGENTEFEFSIQEEAPCTQ